MKSLETQALLMEQEIDFFGNQEWPGNSPDLNACEHLGSVMKDRVESRMIELFPDKKFTRHDLMHRLVSMLDEMKSDTELFENLLRFDPERLRAVKEAAGGHT